jgi:hypothetical protein
MNGPRLIFQPKGMVIHVPRSISTVSIGST